MEGLKLYVSIEDTPETLNAIISEELQSLTVQSEVIKIDEGDIDADENAVDFDGETDVSATMQSDASLSDTKSRTVMGELYTMFAGNLDGVNLVYKVESSLRSQLREQNINQRSQLRSTSITSYFGRVK